MSTSPEFSSRAVEAALLRAAVIRGVEASLCPSEVARGLSADWRPLLPVVRAAGARLVRRGVLRCTQQGREVDPVRARGPIRFQLVDESFDREAS
jgi:hypothetical protein